jgi:hypothetical protein
MPYKKRRPRFRIYFQLFRQKYTSSNNSVAEALKFDAVNMKNLHLIRQWASEIYFSLYFLRSLLILFIQFPLDQRSGSVQKIFSLT